MRKMSGGREKLQLHIMNRAEFSWAWKRIRKGIWAHFHSARVSVSGILRGSEQGHQQGQMQWPTFHLCLVPGPLPFLPSFWRSSIFISKVWKSSWITLTFNLNLNEFTWNEVKSQFLIHTSPISSTHQPRVVMATILPSADLDHCHHQELCAAALHHCECLQSGFRWRRFS